MKPTFEVYSSEEDGVTVVHVCTEGMPENLQGPIIRVYLNDDPIFENPVYPGRAKSSDDACDACGKSFSCSSCQTPDDVDEDPPLFI
jgi:hypothetical protein